MSTRPSNFQEINDKFWIALGLYCVSMVLVGYAVYTNVKASNDIGLANLSVANANISTLRKGNEDLTIRITNLNSMLGKIDTLNREVLAKNLIARADLETYEDKYKEYIKELENTDSGNPELRSVVIRGYNNFLSILNVSKVFMDDKIASDKEIEKLGRQHERELREKDKYIKSLEALMN